MKKGLHILISSAVLLAVLSLLVFIGVKGRTMRSQIACTGLSVEILDAPSLGFVSKEDVKNALEGQYGPFVGQRLQSMDLRRVEEILDGKTAILKSEAYTTPDGILHVEVLQREPIIQFKTSQGAYYADETGYVFPLVEGYQAKVSVIEGDNPMDIKPGYKGSPTTKKGRKWLSEVVELMKFVESSKDWNESIKTIKTDRNGELTLYPSVGRERFIFGEPSNCRDKFDRLGKYYKNIVPAKEEGCYTIVNVKFDGQIVCRRK